MNPPVAAAKFSCGKQDSAINEVSHDKVATACDSDVDATRDIPRTSKPMTLLMQLGV